MADRVGVMSAGRLEQIGPPAELYDRPKTRFVAEFVGPHQPGERRRPGTARSTVLGQSVPLLQGSAGPGPVMALVRPESVRLQPDPPAPTHVLAVSFLGSLCRVQVGLADGELIAAQLVRRRECGPGRRRDRFASASCPVARLRGRRATSPRLTTARRR